MSARTHREITSKPTSFLRHCASLPVTQSVTKWDKDGIHLSQPWDTNGIRTRKVLKNTDKKHIGNVTRSDAKKPNENSGSSLLRSVWSLSRPIGPTGDALNRQVAKRETSGLAYRGWHSQRCLSYTGVFAALVWVLIAGPLAAEGWAKPDQSSWRQVSAFGVTKQKTSLPFGKSFALPRSSKTERLLDLIAKAESPRLGYDAIHHSASRLPNKRPSQMTISEIFGWIKSTPGQHHAIGRYQFIPATLARVVKALDVAPNSRFSPALQDRLAGVLLVEAGYTQFQDGKLTTEAFQDRLAKVWAGLPLHSGKSAYHGIAGNRATVSRTWFDQEMQRIFKGRV